MSGEPRENCSRCGVDMQATRTGVCRACRRKAANLRYRAAHAPTTFIGEPCLKCGESKRYASNRNCVKCLTARNQRQLRGAGEKFAGGVCGVVLDPPKDGLQAFLTGKRIAPC